MKYYNSYDEELEDFARLPERLYALENDKRIPSDICENGKSLNFDVKYDSFTHKYNSAYGTQLQIKSDGIQKYEGKTFIINRIPSGYFNFKHKSFNRHNVFNGLEDYVGEKVSFIKFLSYRDALCIPYTGNLNTCSFDNYYYFALFRVQQDDSLLILQNSEITDDLSWKPSNEFIQKIKDIKVKLEISNNNNSNNNVFNPTNYNNKIKTNNKVGLAFLKEQEIKNLKELKRKEAEEKRIKEEERIKKEKEEAEKRRIEEERIKKEKEEAERLEEIRKQEERKKYEELKAKHIKKLCHVSIVVALYIVFVVQCIFVYNMFKV